jgi:uncharacterized membrane protein
MRLVVDSGVPPAYPYKLIVGMVVIIALDSMWLGSTYTSLYKKGVARPRAKATGGCCALLYAAISAAVAATVTADTEAEAAAAGAVLGMLAFAVFNITTFAMNQDWTATVAIIDTAYGTAAWATMCAAQYSVT